MTESIELKMITRIVPDDDFLQLSMIEVSGCDQESIHNDDPMNSAQEFDDLLVKDTNEMLKKGMLVMTLLGYTATPVLIGMIYFGIARDFEIPTLWAFSGGTMSLIVYLLARQQLIRGWVRYLVAFFFVSMPSSLFVAAHIYIPSGAATYISGPASYLYFVFIIVSGFFFNKRLPFFTGCLAATEYTIALFVDYAPLKQLSHPDPLLLQDFTGIPIYLFKAQMMVFAGLAVGVFAAHARVLIFKMLKEEGEKQQLDRLFGEYVSPEVKTRLIAKTHETVGEKKSVVILFSDIRSFSTISEQLSPEDVVFQLNEYLNRMVKCINEQGGVIDKFIGDAVMANFGGLLDLENASRSAVLAGLNMVKELDKLNREWWDSGRPAFASGIGIHFGEVLQGSIGSQNKKEFTVIGDAVNTASRLESLTKDYPYPIIISDAVYAQLPPDIQSMATSVGQVQIKGRFGEVNVYGFGRPS